MKVPLMTRKAILFGSIGTIADITELEREAYNQAFAEDGLEWNWSKPAFSELRNAPGGRDRIAAYAEASDVRCNPFALHQRKVEIFSDAVARTGLTPRPGVMELIGFAKQNGIKVALCTTTSRANVEAVLNGLDGALLRSTFDFVGDVESVAAAKPDPEIFETAMAKMDVFPSQCLAIEDTPFAFRAALAAGIDCVAFPGADYQGADFDGAYAVVQRLSSDLLRMTEAAA